MTENVQNSLDQRLLVLAPTSKDASLTQSVLQRAQIPCNCCSSLDDLIRELDVGAGAVLIAEESLDLEGGNNLRKWLDRQPPWSDLPVLFLARSGADSAAIGQAMEQLGNITVLERPMRQAALVSSVRTALRGRRRQYETRSHLAQIERSEQNLRDFFENASVGIHCVGPDGIILRVNQTELDMLGYTREEYVGQHIADFHLDQQLIADVLRRLHAGETLENVEAQMRCKNGSVKYVLLNSNALWEDGQFIHSRCFTRDITDRKDFEDVTAHLAAIVASSDDAIISKTLDGIIVTWNAGAERVFGYRAAEVIGKPVTLLIPPDRQNEEPVILERLRRGERIDHYETVRVTKDGRYIDISLTVSPVCSSDGRIIGASKVARDITQRKQAEAALRDADRRKDEFLAVLAHELRNPLAPIHNSLHILRMKCERDSSNERVFEMMERQVNHMVRLVDDLLEVSRITRGKIVLRTELVELASVVRSAVETSRPFIDSSNHQLAVTFPPEPLTLEGDPVRLSQIIANLLNNAAKYTDPGGQIWLSVRREDNWVTISIRDTGTGIPPEMLPRVFDLFVQIDRNSGRAQGGLGIGLALVKSLVEMHGGTVKAFSEGSGRGSEFVVRLPLVNSPRPIDAPRTPAKSPAVLASKRVLVVDDNRDAAQSLGTLLRLLGADVYVAYNGPDALIALGEHKPTAVVLDIGMPGMDGHEVARRIRELSEFQDVTLIALTGWGQEDDRRRSEQAGFDYHLIKPADIGALQVLLQSLESTPSRRHK